MPAPAWLVATPIAHRGLHDETHPENSLSAIEAALQRGFPVEIDVQVSADGRAVVFHDWNLLRLTGFDARVKMTSSAEIAKLRIEGGSERIPLLEDVLDLIGGRQGVIIEIKNRKRPCALEQEVSRILRDYPGDAVIHSFNPFSLGWFRSNHPSLCRGQISCSFDTDDMAGWKKIILANYGMNWMSRPQFISHHWKQLPAIVPWLLRRVLGMPLLAWTVRSVGEQDAALRYSDNFFFETYVPSGKHGPQFASAL
ncbi:MAG TPA: glycerophosphodiester phosphodiesterase family protein [Terrimicrobiaceae bacterium]